MKFITLLLFCTLPFVTLSQEKNLEDSTEIKLEAWDDFYTVLVSTVLNDFLNISNMMSMYSDISKQRDTIRIVLMEKSTRSLVLNLTKYRDEYEKVKEIPYQKLYRDKPLFSRESLPLAIKECIHFELALQRFKKGIKSNCTALEIEYNYKPPFENAWAMLTEVLRGNFYK